MNKGNIHDATIHDISSSSGGGGGEDFPEKFDCDSSIDSGIYTIDGGDEDSSDQDDDNNNNRDDEYQGPSPLSSNEQLVLASMMQSSGDLIRFLTAHGGRLHGLHENNVSTISSE